MSLESLGKFQVRGSCLRFCTLFDSNFLSRGLALYSSLIRHAPESILYVYCFDDLSHRVLKQLALKSLVPVALDEFESAELLAIKPTRSAGEYCWTCTPHVIQHAIKQFNLPNVIYLDADLYFFESPQLLIDEWGAAGSSVLITEHRYTHRYDHARRFGIYCVQFMGFRSNKAGMAALGWWADRCLEWCYAKDEDGKFGDQKYLDDWPVRFDGVHVLQHLGGGVAPWNSEQYEVLATDDATIELRELSTSQSFPLVFYHFHGFQIFNDGEIDFAPYSLGKGVKEEVYKRYLDGMREAAEILASVSDSNFHGLRERSRGVVQGLKAFKRRWSRRLNGSLNVMCVSDLKKLT